MLISIVTYGTAVFVVLRLQVWRQCFEGAQVSIDSARLQIETSTGDTKSFAPGEVILVEDTTGKGHRTKNLEPKTRRSVFISF